MVNLAPVPSALIPDPLTKMMRTSSNPQTNKKEYPIDLIKTLAGNLVKGVSKNIIYNPETKQVFPQSPYWKAQEVAKETNPELKKQKQITMAKDLVMAGTVNAPQAVGANKVIKGLAKMPVDDVVALDLASERLAQLRPDQSGNLSKLAIEARKDIERLAEGYLGKNNAEKIFSKYKNANTAYRKIVDELQKLAGDTPPTNPPPTPQEIANQKLWQEMDNVR